MDLGINEKQWFFYARDGWTREYVAQLLVDRDLHSVLPVYTEPHQMRGVYGKNYKDGKLVVDYRLSTPLYYIVRDENLLVFTSLQVELKAFRRAGYEAKEC